LLDSSVSSSEFDLEIRDKVKSEPVINDIEDGDFNNTDLKYFKIMEPIEKFMTIANRTKMLKEKAKAFEE
jgi:hypothetical protein